MKISLFWDVTPYSQYKISEKFPASIFRIEEWGFATLFCNIIKYLPDYMVARSKRRNIQIMCGFQGNKYFNVFATHKLLSSVRVRFKQFLFNRGDSSAIFFFVYFRDQRKFTTKTDFRLTQVMTDTGFCHFPQS
jgi:hypothetical protein